MYFCLSFLTKMDAISFKFRLATTKFFLFNPNWIMSEKKLFRRITDQQKNIFQTYHLSISVVRRIRRRQTIRKKMRGCGNKLSITLFHWKKKPSLSSLRPSFQTHILTGHPRILLTMSTGLVGELRHHQYHIKEPWHHFSS